MFYSSRRNSDEFVFVMEKLYPYLKQMSEKSAQNLPFYNIQVLKYEVKLMYMHMHYMNAQLNIISIKVVLDNAGSLPLQLSCFWKCDPTVTVYRLNYSYDPSRISSPSPLSLKHVSVSFAAGNKNISSTSSVPVGVWSQEECTMTWKIGELKPNDGSSERL